MRLANGARDRRRLERLAIGRLGIAGELALGVYFGDVGVALAEVLEAVHLELERRADAALVAGVAHELPHDLEVLARLHRVDCERLRVHLVRVDAVLGPAHLVRVVQLLPTPVAYGHGERREVGEESEGRARVLGQGANPVLGQGANPVRGNIWSRRFPESIITGTCGASSLPSWTCFGHIYPTRLATWSLK
eukprot:scaffold18873_cov70-Phaeocystis_antarctica.AAC.1